ncbi:MAG: ABC transporter ATP-binding protein, partial [Mesorhizobium sp.]
MPLLDIKNLTVSFDTAAGPFMAVQGIDLSIEPREVLAIVGESGSGKSVAMLAVMGLLPNTATVKADRMAFDGIDLLELSPSERRKIVGKDISMIFQEPIASLNPCFTAGFQIEEVLRFHLGMDRAQRRARAIELMKLVGIADPEERLNSFPHQMSGGQCQRVMIAIAIACNPKLLIADEPTTALDTLVQRDVLDLMVELTRENGTAVLLISHDLGMVSHYVNNVTVMCEGKAVEQGSSTQVLHAPQHDYTKRLVDALPKRSAGGSRKTVDGPPLVEISNVVIDYPGRPRLFGRAPPKRAVDGVDLTIRRGETLALVGASGSGKTTLGRAIVGLVRPASGTISFLGTAIANDRSADARAQRRGMQIVFQDPYSSLDPRQSIAEIITEPLKLDTELDRKRRTARMDEVIEEVGLTRDLLERFPHQLSGGQRQRV